MGGQVSAICYPAGAFDEHVTQLADEVGYKLGFTTQFGFVDYPIAGNELLTLTRFDMRGNNKYEAGRFLGELPLRRFRKGWPLKN